MEFKNLRKEVINISEKAYIDRFKKLNSEEGIKELLSFYGKSYKGNVKKKLKKFLENRQQKEIKQELERINVVENAKDFSGRLILTVEWKKSRMWGANPRVYTNYGYIGSSIGGCGYCKTSTATAEGLNSHLPLLKLLYKKKEENIKEKNHKLLGYGSGYFLLPSFEGGVGVSSHEDIINNLGLKWENVTQTDSTNVYIVGKD